MATADAFGFGSGFSAWGSVPAVAGLTQQNYVAAPSIGGTQGVSTPIVSTYTASKYAAMGAEMISAPTPPAQGTGPVAPSANTGGSACYTTAGTVTLGSTALTGQVAQASVYSISLASDNNNTLGALPLSCLVPLFPNTVTDDDVISGKIVPSGWALAGDTVITMTAVQGSATGVTITGTTGGSALQTAAVVQGNLPAIMPPVAPQISLDPTTSAAIRYKVGCKGNDPISNPPGGVLPTQSCYSIQTPVNAPIVAFVGGLPVPTPAPRPGFYFAAAISGATGAGNGAPWPAGTSTTYSYRVMAKAGGGAPSA